LYKIKRFKKQKKINFIQIKNIYYKVAPPVPDAFPRSFPSLRIGLSDLLLFPHRTLAKNTRE